MTRLDAFPLPVAVMPARLKALLEPVTTEQPNLKIEVAASFEHDKHGPAREALHMTMLVVPARKAEQLGVLEESSTGVVTSAVRMTDKKGGLRGYNPLASGYDPIVMSWGSGSDFAYNLSEKVWTSLGLSPRCFGNLNQRIVFDDAAAPEFSVAEGEISRTYYFEGSRNVSWTMRNDYLRRYLWMRGAVGVRVFFYEGLLEDGAAVRAIMQGKTHYLDEQDGSWYILDIREWEGKLLLQVWATVPAVAPKLCPEPDVHKLVWPGDRQPMTKVRASEASARIAHLFLQDTFLEKYEQDSIYDTVPVRTRDGVWLCSPAYGGKWSFAGCRRVGRNLVRVEVYELYNKGVPAREIFHAYAHAIGPDEVAQFPPEEEHIPAKVQRLLDQLLDLGDHLAGLGDVVGVPHKDAEKLIGFSRAEAAANGWLHYPPLCNLAQVAPLAMTQQAFLARCKSLNELLQKTPQDYLTALVKAAGCTDKELKNFGGRLKLMQALFILVDGLRNNGEGVASFAGSAEAFDWRLPSDVMSAVFVNYDLRNASAHDLAGQWLRRLEGLGFDTAQLNDGYGRALDFMFDGVIASLQALNQCLRAVLAS